MSLARGRILRAGAASGCVSVALPPGGAPRGRRLPAEVVEAADRARAIVAAAEERARAIIAEAERCASDVRLGAEEIGRADALAGVAALALELRDSEARAEERELSRVVDLARLLAERIVGRVLDDRPSLVLDLAHRVLDEARGARRIRIHAHPIDAGLLAPALADFDPDGRVHAIVEDATLGRGDLLLETDIGVVHAELGAQLERLAQRLRQVLRS